MLHGKRLVLSHGTICGVLLTSSYSHAVEVHPDLFPGQAVEQGDIIGWTGSTGTSHLYASDDWSELHFELRLNGYPLGAGLSPIEAGRLYAAAFSEEIDPCETD